MSRRHLLDEAVLGPAFVRQAWGELNEAHYPWITTTVSVTRHTSRLMWEVGLSVSITDHHHGESLVSMDLQGIRATATSVFSDREMALDKEGQVVWGAFESTIEKIAPRLFEHDPRIGRPPSHLTTCRLFDPPWGTIRPAFYSTMQEPAEAPCSLCGEVFEDNHPPIWGGGNVLWVHWTCWDAA